ncbi:MAG: MFS transporter [Dehalococcoidia bacterium]
MSKLEDTAAHGHKKSSFFISVLPFFIVAHCVHHLLTSLPQPLLPFIRAGFNLTYTQSAFVISSFALANAFSQLPAGFLADRIGTRALVTIGIVGVAVAGLMVGLSQTYVMMLVFLMIMGLAAGGYHPAATPMISSAVEPNQRGRALGFHLIGGHAAHFLTPVIAGAIAGANILGLSWHAAFLVLAIPTAIFGIFFHFFMKRHPDMTQERAAPGKSLNELMPSPGNIRRLVSFLILTVLGGGLGMSIIAFLSLYAIDKFGVSEQVAASMLSIVWSAGLWAGPIGGYLSDRIGRVPIIVATGLASSLFIYMLNFAPWAVWFLVLLLFIGISNSMRMPVAEAFIIDQTTVRNRSTIYGIYYFTMGGTGAVFAPIMGSIIDHRGFNTCFTIVAILVVVVTLICAPFLRGSSRS